MKKILASTAIVLGLLGQAGHAEDFPQAGFARAAIAASVNHATAGMQALRASFPTLAPMTFAAAGADRPSHEIQSSSIQFPGVTATSPKAATVSVADQGTLRMNRFQAISLR